MNDELDRKLQAMPTAKLNPERKQVIHESLMNDEPMTNRKLWGKSRWFLSTVGGISVVSILALFIFTMPQNPFTSHSFLAAEELETIEELKEIERPILLPTYAPFEVNEFQFDQQYHGPKKLENDKMIPIEQDNPKFYVQNFYYRTNESPIKMIHVALSDGSVTSMGDEYEKVEFDNGKIGEYNFNGNTQTFHWIEDGILINLLVWVENKDKTFFREGPIPLEEIIKIAESFEVYNK
ncbi:hypothetical protein ACLM5H_21290 [Fredinandcohnia humi]